MFKVTYAFNVNVQCSERVACSSGCDQCLTTYDLGIGTLMLYENYCFFF